MRPDCYNCKYIGDVPGSAHNRCLHPSVSAHGSSALDEVNAILASVGRVAPVSIDTGLNIKGSEWGIRKGWFNWPYNFDPVWLENCDGFVARDDLQPIKENDDAN